MVYIECLIMEVNVNKDFELGTEWLVMGETSYNDRRGGVGGGFGGNTDYSNIQGIVTPNAAGAGTLPAGFSLGLFSEAVNIGGVLFPNLAAVVSAYQKDEDVHILSTPQVLTTDHEEAAISVGKNVPYLTKSGSSEIEAYNTYEYRDVGITLKITPHITRERMVRLKISQEVSKLDELSTASSATPVTLKTHHRHLGDCSGQGHGGHRRPHRRLLHRHGKQGPLSGGHSPGELAVQGPVEKPGENQFVCVSDPQGHHQPGGGRQGFHLQKAGNG